MLRILDTTLRDGSYAVDFSFSLEDVKQITRKLEKSGIEFIEIGHGLGFSAQNKGYGKSPHTDIEYIQAAREATSDAHLGMFCIPEIAEVDNIDSGARAGLTFVRVGADIDKIEGMEPYIRRAKKRNMLTMANFMKSYAIPPSELAQKAIVVESFGADIIYIADSAGFLTPDQLEEYIIEVKKVSNVQLGFHGHDNLGLAMANSLKAIELGVEFIDTTIHGLGRSAGNLPTELLVATLKKMGYDTPVNPFELLDLLQDDVSKFHTNTNRFDEINILCGFVGFHSSFFKKFEIMANQYEVDVMDLIEEYSKHEKINLYEELAMECANQIKNRKLVLIGGTHD
jgi:4-hydroxy 2-oxovalerate aldolase